MLSATNVTFPAQSIGTMSQPIAVSFVNTGSSTLTINSMAISPQFFTETNNCGNSLPPGRRCLINVFFEPQLQGILVGTLTVQDDGVNGQHSVSLTGIGQ
jgi:hypothetical protein